MPSDRAKKVRWGILGVAKINRRLIPAFGLARNAELRAIASRSMEKARAAATADGIPVAHGSYEALLDDADIDAVYIPLPNALHAEVRAGRPRQARPLRKTTGPHCPEARELVDYCQRRTSASWTRFMWPQPPRTARLRDFLDKGGIGDICRVSGSFTFPLGLEDRDNIRLRPELCSAAASWMWAAIPRPPSAGLSPPSCPRLGQPPEYL